MAARERQAHAAEMLELVSHDHDVPYSFRDEVDLLNETTNTKRFRQLLLISLRQAVRVKRAEEAAGGWESYPNPVVTMFFPPAPHTYMCL
jgi:hypothetical protein